MSLGERSEGAEWLTTAQAISADNSLGADATLLANARAWAVLPYRDGFLAFFTSVAEARMLSRTYEQGTWKPSKPITPIGAAPNYVSFAARDDAAVVTWQNAASKMSAAVFDGTSWSATELAPVQEGASPAVGPKRHIAVWYTQGAAYAALYEVATGWDDPTKLGPTTGTSWGPGVAVDDVGNALSAWANESEIAWRRYSDASRQWGPIQSLEDQDPTGAISLHASTTGDVMLIWQNELGVWASRFE